MKILLIAIALFGLSGCAAYNDLTPRQQQTVQIVGGVIAASIIISANDGDTTIINNKSCHGHGKKHKCDRD